MESVKPIIRYSIEDLLKFSHITDPPKELLDFDKSILKRFKKKTDEDTEYQGQVKSILNKMTWDTFEKLTADLLKIKLTNLKQLEKFVDLVFDKAVLEPDFSNMYALLCSKLAKIKVQENKAPEIAVSLVENTVVDNKPAVKKFQFQQLLLNKCQQEFEKRLIPEQTELEEKYPDPDDIELFLEKNKRKKIGLMKFIGELHNLNFITQKIVDGCLFFLLKNIEPKSALGELHLECICTLVTTTLNKLKTRTDPLFNEFVKNLKKMTEKNVSSRIKFMIANLFEKGLKPHRIV